MTSIDISLLYDTWLVSVAVIVIEYFPVPAFGSTVPEMMPFESIDKPLGKMNVPGTQTVVFPPQAEKVYPPAPPTAAMFAMYGWPCVAFGSVPLVVMSMA